MVASADIYPIQDEPVPAPPVQFAGDRLRIHFQRFGIPEYQVFLKAKALPESETVFHEEDETYSITAPARFATLLGVERPRTCAQSLPLAECLYDDQREITRLALEAKRFACWSDCGLGKTLIELEFARQVVHRTGGRFLIVTLNEIVPQFLDEARKFYGDAYKLLPLDTRINMRAWMKEGMPGVAITNYEKWNPDADGQVVPEARHLAGIALDESSRLKTGGGRQKWALIHSCRGIEYKLSCTATPAPNEIMEFASQASFLEKMRSDEEIIWTFFVRDPVTHRWTVKPHARKAFFEFMSSWSIYVQNPKRYGWRLDLPDVPEPVTLTHEIQPTEEQLAWRERLLAEAAATGQRRIALDEDEGRSLNFVQANKLAQVAKGFRYRGDDEEGEYDRIRSPKPAFVADLVDREARAGHQVLVWTVYEAESEILAEHLHAAGVGFELLTGATKKRDRGAVLDRFRSGQSRVLVTRAKILGYGMNLQCVSSMVFSGFDYSFESYYQAVRRAYRHGQLRSLRIHVPWVAGLENEMLDAQTRKQRQHDESVAEMELHYIRNRAHLLGRVG